MKLFTKDNLIKITALTVVFALGTGAIYENVAMGVVAGFTALVLAVMTFAVLE